MASLLAGGTNGSVVCLQSEPTSFRRRIGISRELFELTMNNMEKNFNKICSKYSSIYFCSKDFDSRIANITLILNVMGCDKDSVDRASEELFGLLKRISITDNLNFLDLPMDLDRVIDHQSSSPLLKKPHVLSQSCVHSRRPVDMKDGEDKCDDVSSVVSLRNNILVRVSCIALVKQEAEAVVCITNCRLQCTETASRDVVAAVGTQHKMDCENFLRERGSMKPCQVMHASAGNLFLTVRKIIYVAEPKVEQTKQHCMLEDLYFNCLQYANEIKVESVSLPFLNSDLNRITAPVVAIAICKALIKFDEQFTESPNNLKLRRVNIACPVKKAAIIQKTVFDIFQSKLKRFRDEEQELLSTSITNPPRNCFSLNGNEAVDDCSNKQTPLIPDDQLWWKNRIITNSAQLELEISMESGLEGELMKLEAFQPMILRRSMEASSEPEKVHRLLKNLLQGNEQMFQKFCEALCSTGQQFIVSQYFVKESLLLSRAKSKIPRSVTDSTIREDLKLLQRWKCENLRKHHNDLIDNIICDLGLIGNLKSLFVFTGHQMAELEGEMRQTNRNRLMLQWLERGSEATHKKFCAALRENNQAHIVTNYLLESNILVEYF